MTSQSQPLTQSPSLPRRSSQSDCQRSCSSQIPSPLRSLNMEGILVEFVSMVWSPAHTPVAETLGSSSGSSVLLGSTWGFPVISSALACGSLIPLALPWSIVTLALPRISESSAVPHPATSLALPHLLTGSS